MNKLNKPATAALILIAIIILLFSGLKIAGKIISQKKEVPEEDQGGYSYSTEITAPAQEIIPFFEEEDAE